MSIPRIREYAKLLTLSLGRPLYIGKAAGSRKGWSIPTPGRVCGQWRAETRVRRDYQTRTGLAGGRSNEGFIGWDDRTHPRGSFIRPHPLLLAVISTADAGADLFVGCTEGGKRGKGWRNSFSISPSTDEILRAFFWLKIIFFPASSFLFLSLLSLWLKLSFPSSFFLN